MVLQAGGVQGQGGLSKQGREVSLRQEVQTRNEQLQQLVQSLDPAMSAASLARAMQKAAELIRQRDRAVGQLESIATPLKGLQAAQTRDRMGDLTAKITQLDHAIEPNMAAADLAKIQLQKNILESQRAVLGARLEASPNQAPSASVRAAAGEIPALEARMKKLAGELKGLSDAIGPDMSSVELMKLNGRIDQVMAEMDKVGAKLTVARAQAAKGTDRLQLSGGVPAKPGEAEALKKELVKIKDEMMKVAQTFSPAMDSVDLTKAQGRLSALGQEVDRITARLKEIQAQGKGADPMAGAAPGFAQAFEPDGRPLGLKSSGPRVEAVQQFLADGGYGAGNVDGKYGPETAKGVRAFQSAMGLKVDGVSGPNTLRAMAIMQAVEGANKAAAKGSSSERVQAFEALNQAQDALAKLPAGEQAKLGAQLQAAQRALGPVVDPDALAEGIGAALGQAATATREVVEIAQADRSGFLGWLFGANSSAIVEKVQAGEITTEAGRAAARARLADDMAYSPAEAQAYGKLLADSVKAGALSPEQLVVELAKYESGTKGDDVVRSLVAELDYSAVKALPKEVKKQLLAALAPAISHAGNEALHAPELEANLRAKAILDAALRGDAKAPGVGAASWDRQDFYLLA